MKKVFGVAMGAVFFTGMVVGGFLSAMMLNEYNEEKPVDVKEGDLIQWQSQGVLQFPEPKRVTDVKSDFIGGKESKYVFVEGSTTGIPIDEVALAKENA